MVYMLLAFSWWAVLLFRETRENFNVKTDLLKLNFQLKNPSLPENEFFTSPEFLFLRQRYQRQKRMIGGEVTVFSVTLLIGLWLIHRGHRQELAAARQQKNFLLSITHELKSPIASIRLVLETFQKRTLDAAQAQKLTSGALVETERLNELVNDLLLSAKLETAYHPQMEMMNVEDWLKKATADFAQRHPNVRLKLLLSENIPPLLADYQGLSTLLINLLDNALKYNFEDEKQLRVSAKAEKGHVVVEVADNGIGIADEEKKSVFKKFYRSGSEDTRRTKGTGLGLYIVHEIVKAHNGSIRIRDNQPKGTIFEIRLPAKNATA